MQDAVDLRGAGGAMDLRPKACKGQMIGAAAFGAGAVARRIGRGLIEEKEFRIAARLHQLAVAVLEAQHAADPVLMSKGAADHLALMQDATVAHQQAALGHGMERPLGRDAVHARHQRSNLVAPRRLSSGGLVWIIAGWARWSQAGRGQMRQLIPIGVTGAESDRASA